MHDAEYQHDLLVVQDVVHDPIVTYPQAMEGVAGAVDRLDGLPPDAARFRRVRGQLLECRPDPRLEIRIELLEGANGDRRQLDVVGGQSRSSRLVDRPPA